MLVLRFKPAQSPRRAGSVLGGATEPSRDLLALALKDQAITANKKKSSQFPPSIYK